MLALSNCSRAPAISWRCRVAVSLLSVSRSPAVALKRGGHHRQHRSRSVRDQHLPRRARRRRPRPRRPLPPPRPPSPRSRQAPRAIPSSTARRCTRSASPSPRQDYDAMIADLQGHRREGLDRGHRHDRRRHLQRGGHAPEGQLVASWACATGRPGAGGPGGNVSADEPADPALAHPPRQVRRRPETTRA